MKLLLAAAAAAVLVAAPAAQARPRVFIPVYHHMTTKLVSKPSGGFPIAREMHMGISFNVTHARWRKWGTRMATATVTGDVIPNGGKPPWEQFTTKVIVGSPYPYASCDDEQVYAWMSTTAIRSKATGKVIVPGEDLQFIAYNEPIRCP